MRPPRNRSADPASVKRDLRGNAGLASTRCSRRRVDDSHRSPLTALRADLLILKGQEIIGGQTHDVCRAIQIHDLEAMLARHCIAFSFGSSASDWAAITAPDADYDNIDHLN